MENLNFRYKREKIKLKVHDCNWLMRFKGLMFCRGENAEALLFRFRKESGILIHSFFVFFPFVAVWLDSDNEVVDVKVVKPFTLGVKPTRAFSKLVEIPINKRYKKEVVLLVGN